MCGVPASADAVTVFFVAPLRERRADMRCGFAVRRQEYAAERRRLVKHARRPQIRILAHRNRNMHPSADHSPDAEGRGSPRSACLLQTRGGEGPRPPPRLPSRAHTVRASNAAWVFGMCAAKVCARVSRGARRDLVRTDATRYRHRTPPRTRVPRGAS